jgi:hypothetical protein
MLWRCSILPLIITLSFMQTFCRGQQQAVVGNFPVVRVPESPELQSTTAARSPLPNEGGIEYSSDSLYFNGKASAALGR